METCTVTPVKTFAAAFFTPTYPHLACEALEQLVPFSIKRRVVDEYNWRINLMSQGDRFHKALPRHSFMGVLFDTEHQSLVFDILDRVLPIAIKERAVMEYNELRAIFGSMISIV